MRQPSPMPQALRELSIKSKGPGVKFVGREKELDSIESQLITQAPTSANPESGNTHVGLLITAAPGAGKTTLQRQATARWAEQGIATIAVRAGSFIDQRSLHDAILDQQLPDKAAKSARIWARDIIKQYGTDALQRWASIVGTTIKNAVTNPEEAIIDGQVQIAKGLNLALAEDKSHQTLRLLQKCDKLFPNGWVFMIDEVQQLKDYTLTDRTRSFLQNMCDPDARSDFKIKHGAIWMTGLGDARSVLQSIGVTRYKRRRLGPIDVDAATRLIERYIEANTTAAKAKKLARVWAPPLAQKYHVWAHHLAGAAQAAGWVAAEDPDHEDALAWIEQKAQLNCEELYNDKLADLHEVAKSNKTIALAVSAVTRAKHPMDIDELELLIMRYGKTGEVGSLGEPQAAEIAQALVHNGMLEYDEVDGLVVPIPSLSTHVANKVPMTPGMEEILSSVG